MKKNCIVNLSFSILLLLTTQATIAQENNIILKAMNDEMTRSLNEIKYSGHDKPFYIGYGVHENKSYSIFASLGAIISSEESKNRQKSVRILVGDYEFNDESLDNDLTSDLTAHEIELPLDDDYYGIRRAFWTTTDAVYKGAAQKYKKHQETLKEDNKSIKDLPHRTFAKVPPLHSVAKETEYAFDKIRLETYCKEISSIFRKYPDIEGSDVFLNETDNTDYLVNSEGSMIVKPKKLIMLQCRVQLKTKKGTPVFDQFVYYAETPEQLPSLNVVKKQSEDLMEKLTTMLQSNDLEEEYSGPVLFTGYPVAQLFSNTLFSNRESLTSTNMIPGKNGFRPDSGPSLEARIGKSIIDNAISIKATPRLKTFNGKPLLGSFDFDDEGVAPPEELVLVEKGILKNLMNDRSLTKAEQTANGFGSGPGVVQISINTGITFEALKQKLITLAHDESLDYAVIVRDYSGTGQIGLVEVYKVSLETGKEELMRPSRLNNLMLKNLKRISGTTAQNVHHVPLGNGGLVSFITPEALLVEQAEIVPFKLPYTREDETFVESPLKK